MELIATETGLKSVQWEPFKNMAAWRRNAFRWDQRAGLFEKCWKIRLRGSVKGRQEESVNNMAICVVSEQFTSNRRRKMIHILHLSVQRKQQKHSDFDLRKLVYVENHVTIGFGELWKSSFKWKKSALIRLGNILYILVQIFFFSFTFRNFQNWKSRLTDM